MKALNIIFYVALIIALILEVSLPHHNFIFWYQQLPGFHSALGFLGCIFLIIFAKFLGEYWLGRDEDYYD